MLSADEPIGLDPQIAASILRDPEGFADQLQTALVFKEVSEISGKMKSLLSTEDALTQFSTYWPHVYKAWNRLCRSDTIGDLAKNLDFLRLATPLLVATGEREVLNDLITTIEQKVTTANAPALSTLFFYCAAILHIQYRRYSAALPLLTEVREKLPPEGLDPSLPEVLTALGAVYMGLGREQEAAAVFEELARIVFLKGWSFPFTEESMNKIYNSALDRMLSGTGLALLLARPPKTLSPSSSLQSTPSFFRRS